MGTTARMVSAVCVSFLCCILLSRDALANTFVVNTGDDVVDPDACDIEHCSFREAILAAEQNAGEDTILFDGDYVISPVALLPMISDTLIIDGSGHSVTLDGSAYLSSNSITCPAQFLGDRSHPGLVFYRADNSELSAPVRLQRNLPNAMLNPANKEGDEAAPATSVHQDGRVLFIPSVQR